MGMISYLASEHFGWVMAAILATMCACGMLLRRYGRSDKLRLIIYIIEVLLLALLFSFICIKDEQVKHTEEEQAASFVDDPNVYFTYEIKYVSDL